MDIVINEDDIKKIVKDSLEAKGNKVGEISLNLKTPEIPGRPPGMPGFGPFGNLQNLFASNDPNRPRLYLTCNINND